MRLKPFAFISLILVLIISISVIPANAKYFKNHPRNHDFRYGIDVSKWNDSLNMKQIVDSDVEFGYIRIGTYRKSGGTLDSRFKENVKKFVENGLEFGVYVYSYVYKASDNVKCAKWVVKELKKMGCYTKDTANIHVAYDIEDEVQIKALKNKKISRSGLHKSVMKFCNTVKKYNYQPVVYSFESFFYDNLNVSDFQKNNVKIWWARWPKPANTKVKKKLKNGTNPDVWQFSSTYKIGKTVFDTNVCYDYFYDYSKESSKLRIEGLKSSYPLIGSSVTPSFKVYDGDKLLKNGTDYKLVFFRNNRAGEAVGKIIRYKNGSYFETKTVTFNIESSAVKLIKKHSSYDEVYFKWKKEGADTDYQILLYDKDYNTYDVVDTVKTSEYNYYDLDPNTTYYFKIRPLIKSGGKLLYGPETDFKIKTKIKETVIKSAVSDKKGSVLVKWSQKNDKPKGYEVIYSTKKNFSDTLEKVTDNTSSARLNTLKSGKSYYIKVHSTYKYEDDVAYSEDSKVIKVKVK